MTQRFDSYFVLMKFSILLAASQRLTAVSLLPHCLTLLRAHGQAPTSTPNICQFSVSFGISGTGGTDLLALLLPHRSTLCNCSSVQASRSTDLTLLICVPIPRCIPEQLMESVLACCFLYCRQRLVPNANEDAEVPACPSWICRETVIRGL